MFAVIKTGGKQYQVSEGQKLEIEKLTKNEEGDMVKIESVLLVSNEKDVIVGTPYIEGSYVELKVLDHIKGDKIRGYTYQAKKRHQKTWGHRQLATEVEVIKIHAEGMKQHAKKEEKAELSKEKPEIESTEEKKVKAPKKKVAKEEGEE